jgi:uncharacterized membrane protein YhaH (DUF805 family)
MTDAPASPAAPPAEPPKDRLTFVGVMKLWFGLRTRVSQRAYLTTGVLLTAIKYAVDAGVVYAVTGKFFTPIDYLNPVLTLRTKAINAGPPTSASEVVLIFMILFALPFLWIGVSMTVRRAIDAGKSPWLGLAFFVPILNIPTMVVLAALPSQAKSSWPLPTPPVSADKRLTSALLGVVAGLAIAGAMGGLSIFVLREYGASLFFGTPLVMGAAASYIYNRNHPRGVGDSIVVGLLSVTCAGTAMLLFALEGVFCLAMAFPIAAGLAILGAVIGRLIAVGTKSPATHAATAFLLLPFLAGAEAKLGGPLEGEVTTVREIAAPPEVVWQHVVSFSDLAPPHEWFFEAGIAYPMRARIDGEGIGAVRHCEFSTGAFVEPITVWDAPRRLAFDVTSQPQPMKEWSPYAFVNAPHLEHSIRSQRGEFRLIALDGGTRTRLEGTTWYVLDMAPSLYWRVWAEWLLHAIHGRVLDHIAHLSEA